MKTGEIWLAQLDSTVGSKIRIRKTRPCGVIFPRMMNRHLRTLPDMFAPAAG